MDIKSYIDELFRYLDCYEKKYAEFKTEAFLQTYNGLRAVFKALREERNQAVEVDYTFLDAITPTPLTNSDLRQLTVQILISYFEAVADVDGRSNQSYDYCRKLRAVKQDVQFFEKGLLPLLFAEGALNGNYQLHSFLLEEIGKYLDSFGRSIKTDLKPEDFLAYDDARKFLELSRRRQRLGGALLADRTSLEFHLDRIGEFKKLAHKDRLYKLYLTQWDYLRSKSFWASVKTFLGELGGKGKGLFSSHRYTRFAFSQRQPAFFLLVFLMLFWVAIAVAVPWAWHEYESNQLEKFRQRVENVK
ncbi:MAG: hypothetical protein KOO62_07735 [candidate division Zixibacteria bacterium]|nr:hypothetical protein [candidate division Zixibacteria bacterium]